MTALLLRRGAALVPLLLGVLTLVFVLVDLLPGRPFRTEPGAGVSRESEDLLARAFGADRPVAGRYAAWVAGVLTGDLGVSYSFREPVGGLVLEAARNTFWLGSAALLLQFALGTAAGAAAAVARRGWTDRLVSLTSAGIYAVPSYWLGLLMTWALAVRLGWLPASQMRDPAAPELDPLARVWDLARHMVLPCLALVLPASGGIALYVRDATRAALSRPYVHAAGAKGSNRARTILAHGLRNALLPVVSLFGASLPGIVSGGVVVEVLFAWPGMGRLAYQAVLARDEPLVLGCTLLASALVILGSLAADLLAAALDPRVREAMR